MRSGRAVGRFGLRSWQSRHEIKLPATNTVQLDQLIVYSNSPLPAKHRLLEELNSLREAVNSKLALPPSDEKIHVYLFSEAAELRTYVQKHYPGFPDRRAMFIETDTQLRGVCLLGRPGGRGSAARGRPWISAFGRAADSAVARRRAGRVLRSAARQPRLEPRTRAANHRSLQIGLAAEHGPAGKPGIGRQDGSARLRRSLGLGALDAWKPRPSGCR